MMKNLLSFQEAYLTYYWPMTYNWPFTLNFEQCMLYRLAVELVGDSVAGLGPRGPPPPLVS